MLYVCCSCWFWSFQKEKVTFHNDVHIVEAPNEPMDNSGSGDVSETEYCPSKSDFDSGMWSHCSGMNFKTFILIIARSHYFSNNIVTWTLYCIEQLIITTSVEKMTLPHVVCSHHKQILPNLVLLGHHPQAHPQGGNITPRTELLICIRVLILGSATLFVSVFWAKWFNCSSGWQL